MALETDLQIKFGTILSSAGSIVTAIAATPSFSFTNNQINGLNLAGNVMQAGGNGLVADTETEVLPAASDLLKAAGNIVIISGLFGFIEQIKQQRLFITGNWLQAEGGFLAAFTTPIDLSPKVKSFVVTGNLLQGIGNSLQALGIADNLEDLIDSAAQFPHFDYTYNSMSSPPNSKGISKGTELLFIGSWLQAIGTVLTVIALFLPQEQTEEDSNKEKNNSMPK
ncbi:DUF6944 family repetitive protein [Bacillus sp. 1P06AnD]|uniref:DUF6944 family repetitive protein n=1 Tax=Bacillus sp. 1P06AnD TaxID=3132208 RepID=UPI0039A27D3B